MNILHVYYMGGPEPPEPECMVSRLIKNLLDKGARSPYPFKGRDEWRNILLGM